MVDEHWAKPDHLVAEFIRERWSPVIFEDRGVEPEKLYSLFEAARWAPSSYNDQPWDYVIGIKGRGDGWEKILSTLVPPNQEWAQNAPVLAISVAQNKFRTRDRENIHGWHDVGAASALLCLQATQMGLFVHQMAGFDHDLARKILNIPPHADPVAAIAIGYRGNRGSQGLQDREKAPRERRKVEEFLHEGSWKGTIPD